MTLEVASPRRPGRTHQRVHLTSAAVMAIALAPVGSRSAAAQPGSGEPLTLAAAVALARANHPSLPAASARGRAVVALARQDAAFANPVFEWRQENIGSPLQHDAFATVSQPLDLTGRRLALRETAHDVARRMVADSISVMHDIEANAARAFWRASLARALVVLAEEQRTDAERLARFESERAREGAVAEVSAMRARLEADRARVAEASAAAALTRATAELARATGVVPSALPMVSALAPRVPPLAPVPTSSLAVERALASRSELVALRAAADAARHRYSAERRAMLPDVTVVAGAKQTAGYSTRVIGVAVPLPIFNQNSAGRDRAAAELRFVEA